MRPNWHTRAVRALAITYETDAGPGVFAEAAGDGGMDVWLRTRDPKPPADPASYDAVLSFGGSMHIDQRDEHPWLGEDEALLAGLVEWGIPVMGVCLGAQLLTRALGGRVERMQQPEIGWFEIEPLEAARSDPVMGSLAESRFTGFGWHSYECLLPEGAVALARSEACLQAYRHGERIWAIQFHPEVTLADAESWMDDHRAKPDEDAAELDVEALRSQTRELISPWNELGRGICARFLEAAATRA